MVPKGRHDEVSAISIEEKQETVIKSLSTDGYYLNENARKQLHKYQYNGADLSLLYQYILSPLAAFLVDTVVPKSVAPNTVTSIGLIWMITSYWFYWFYVPTLEITRNDDDDDEESFGSVPPRWIFLWNGIALLAYQTLDNMDGKQARKTQSSSPLGLLFDHGCDAINSIFGSANVIIGMSLTPRENMFEIWLLIFGPFAMFYITTWDQFYTGKLIMPIINGPSEGLFAAAVLSFVSYWSGCQYWQETDWFDAFVSIFSTFSLQAVTEGVQLRNCDFIVIFVALGVFQEIVLKCIVVAQKYKRSAIDLIPFLVLSFGYLIIGWIDPEVWLAIPRTSLHLAMVLFVEMSCEMMLAHVTAQSFNPWRWQVVPLIGITIWVAIFGNSEILQYLIIGYTWSMGAYVTMKCVCVIHEICDVLKIWCFDITTPHYKKIATSDNIGSKLT